MAFTAAEESSVLGMHGWIACPRQLLSSLAPHRACSRAFPGCVQQQVCTAHSPSGT
jgi:hypothetical protein